MLRSLGLGLWDHRRMAEELELPSVPEKVEARRTGSLTFQAGFPMTYDEMAFTWNALYQAEISSRMNEARAVLSVITPT